MNNVNMRVAFPLLRTFGDYLQVLGTANNARNTGR